MKRRIVNTGADAPSTDTLPLSRAARAAEQMRVATDELNARLVRAEKGFAKLGLGVSAAICITAPTEESPWFQNLLFQKDGNEWRFILQSGEHDEDPMLWSESPLLSASREVRVKAAQVLPELLEELIARAERQAVQLRESSSALDTLLDTLERSRAS